MYIAARRISIPSVDAYLREIAKGNQIEHAEEINHCINSYFLCKDMDEIESTMAGDFEANDFLPIADLTSARVINDLKSDVLSLIK
jgi:hypothetical protein